MEIKVGQVWVPTLNKSQPGKVVEILNEHEVTILSIMYNTTHRVYKSVLLSACELATEYLAREAFDKELEELLNAKV